MLEVNPLISIIVPVYNVRRYLIEALKSVVNQTYSNIEIIIVDDGSTDGSGEICDLFEREDARIQVIHQENFGLSAARNVGLDFMKGDAVVFVDSDDILHPDYIRCMTRIMVDCKADIVVCNYSHFREMEKKVIHKNVQPTIKQGPYKREDALCALADGHLNHTVWNKMYIKRLWEDIRYPDGLVYEDIDVTFRVLDKCNAVYVIDDILYYKRGFREDSITETCSERTIKNWVATSAQFNQFIRANIPTVFTREQFENVKYTQFATMISFYARLSLNKKEKAFSEQLRKVIIKTEPKIRKEGREPRIALCFKMIYSCPWLLKRIYSMYYFSMRYIRRYKIKEE